MMRVANFTQGMRVLTPTNKLARIDGVVINTSKDNFPRVKLTFMDPEYECEPLQAKVLRPYVGQPVIFPDEAERMRGQYNDAKAAE